MLPTGIMTAVCAVSALYSPVYHSTHSSPCSYLSYIQAYLPHESERHIFHPQFWDLKNMICMHKPPPKARLKIWGIPTRAQKFWASASSCEEPPPLERLFSDGLKREDWRRNLIPKTVIFQRSYIYPGSQRPLQKWSPGMVDYKPLLK